MKPVYREDGHVLRVYARMGKTTILSLVQFVILEIGHRTEKEQGSY